MAYAKTLKATDIALYDKGCVQGLFVRSLLLTNFRNYKNIMLNTSISSPAPIVLFGQNGAGKTNLLEALSYLAPGRGLRGAKLSEVACHNGDGGWAVSAEIEGTAGEMKIGTGLLPNFRDNNADGEDESDFSGDRRVVRIDGTPASGPAALAEVFSSVWLTPKMDRLFLEAASGRRKFFDRFVQGLHPHHAQHLGAYERAMRERILILCDKNRSVDESWLAALENRMVEHGVALAAARNETLAHLKEHMTSSNGGLFPKANLELEGLLENQLIDSPALRVEDQFKAALVAARGQDRHTGRTSVGPHKTDLLVFHQEKNMPARLCSTGEQKALLISIILADVRMQKTISGFAPILLLDEISAHLDERRRAALFEILLELGCQAWLTGTDHALFSSLQGKATFLSIEDGKINES